MTALGRYIHPNRLLSAHSMDIHHALGENLELVQLTPGQLLYDNGQRITHAYFPATAVLSLTLLMEDGATIEIASVGSEGFVGLPLVMGTDYMPSRVEVRSAGIAYKMRANDLLQEVARSPVLEQAMLRYAQTMMTFISQTSACNRHHSVLQQLCRWLLLAMDRTQSNHLTITQQSIANMLGVRREGVTEATGKLEQMGIIRHSRGHVTITDRTRLETSCCECYAVVSDRFTRLHDRMAEEERTLRVSKEIHDGLPLSASSSASAPASAYQSTVSDYASARSMAGMHRMSSAMESQP